MKLKPLSYDYLSQITGLTWKDILYGIEHQFLTQEAAIDHAVSILSREDEDCEATKDVMNLACLRKGESIHPYIDRLAGALENYEVSSSQDKFLYALLSWLFDNKSNFDDPLGIVEHIYANFDYPPEISGFIKYMPAPQIPLISHEKKLQLLYDNWEKYLEQKRKKYGLAR